MIILTLVFSFISPVANTVLLYIGPDTFMPLLSFLAALGGILLMFGRRILAGVRKFFVHCREFINNK